MKQLLFFAFFFLLPPPVYSDSLVGNITMPGVIERPDIIIKLIPPKSSGLPEQITTTDKLGGYRFEQVEESPYLMELYQGNELIRREAIEVRGMDRKSISLETRF